MGSKKYPNSIDLDHLLKQPEADTEDGWRENSSGVWVHPKACKHQMTRARPFGGMFFENVCCDCGIVVAMNEAGRAIELDRMLPSGSDDE